MLEPDILIAMLIFSLCKQHYVALLFIDTDSLCTARICTFIGCLDDLKIRPCLFFHNAKDFKVPNLWASFFSRSVTIYL